jgi:apolipoprotein D and lipocalin family protein
MASTTAALPNATASSTDAAARLSGDDIEARIAIAESRLLEREARMQRNWATFTARAKRATQPPKLFSPMVMGPALGLIGLWLLRGRRNTYRPPLGAAASGAARGSSAEAPWISLIALAWPLLPARYRSRISPATASAMVALGLPLAQAIVGGRRAPPPVAAASVDLLRYAGTWYEVARMPSLFEKACAGQPVAEYAPRFDGSVDVTNSCIGDDGSVREVHGVAIPVAGGNGAKLRISLAPLWLRWLPMAWSDYWILYVDEAYTEALVATPDRRHLWLLSRSPVMSPLRLQALQQMATMQGFLVDRLQVHQLG